MLDGVTRAMVLAGVVVAATAGGVARADEFDAHALVLEGNALFEAGDYEAAADRYARAMEAEEPPAEALLNRGIALLAIGEMDGASGLLRRVEASPGASGEAVALARYHLGLIEAQRARQVGSDSTEGVDADAEAIARDRLRHLDRAASRFRGALELTPELEPAARNLEITRYEARGLRAKLSELEASRERTDTPPLDLSAMSEAMEGAAGEMMESLREQAQELARAAEEQRREAEENEALAERDTPATDNELRQQLEDQQRLSEARERLDALRQMMDQMLPPEGSDPETGEPAGDFPAIEESAAPPVDQAAAQEARDRVRDALDRRLEQMQADAQRGMGTAEAERLERQMQRLRERLDQLDAEQSARRPGTAERRASEPTGPREPSTTPREAQPEPATQPDDQPGEQVDAERAMERIREALEQRLQQTQRQADAAASPDEQRRLSEQAERLRERLEHLESERQARETRDERIRERREELEAQRGPSMDELMEALERAQREAEESLEQREPERAARAQRDAAQALERANRRLTQEAMERMMRQMPEGMDQEQLAEMARQMREQMSEQQMQDMAQQMQQQGEQMSQQAGQVGAGWRPPTEDELARLLNDVLERERALRAEREGRNTSQGRGVGRGGTSRVEKDW